MTEKIDPRLPILVGVGQCTHRERMAMSPQDIAAEAASIAIKDVGVELSAQIDTLAVVRTFLDSTPYLPQVFGSSNNMPASVARRLGVAPSNLIYGQVGGQSPQRFVNEMAEAIYAGERNIVLVTGAEAIAETKAAQRDGTQHDWSETIDDVFEDRPVDAQFSDYELHHGITFPPQVYALFENAWRHKRGLSAEEHLNVMGQVFAPFSDVAASNPCAQFPVVRDQSFLSSYSKDNYQMNIPHGKWHVAQDAVNQGAAFIMTSVATAQAMGIAEDKWVYLHGRADANEAFVSERVNLSGCTAMHSTIPAALSQAGKHIDDMDFIDFYSCFPIAVLSACDAAGLSWTDERGLTVTGGLPFFGGAGNNYSSHAIVSMVERLRENPGKYGIVSANGGYLTKQSVGIYSTQANTSWHDEAPFFDMANDDQYRRKDICTAPNGLGTIESYTVVYARGQASSGIVIGSMDDGQRFLANIAADDKQGIARLENQEPIGARVLVTVGEHCNEVEFQN